MQAARREAVLTVTHDLIAERGLSGIATLEVAKRAGVSEGLIFQHLETKAGLPAAAARSGETLLACLEAVAEAPPLPPICPPPFPKSRHRPPGGYARAAQDGRAVGRPA
jgi:AcrR family transcriptional regulator